MAVNEQEGYQQKAPAEKQSNAALRDITGAALSPREAAGLTRIFNINPQNPHPDTALSLEEESPAPGAAGTEPFVRQEPFVQSAETPAQPGGPAEQKNQERPAQAGFSGGVVAAPGIAADAPKADARTGPAAENADPEIKGPENHDVLAFKAFALGAGAAGRVHVNLDRENNRATHIGHSDDDEEDPNSPRNQAMNNFLYDQIYNINLQIEQIDIRLGEIDDLLDDLARRKALLQEEQQEIERQKLLAQENVARLDSEIAVKKETLGTIALDQSAASESVQGVEENQDAIRQEIARKIEQNPEIVSNPDALAALIGSDNERILALEEKRAAYKKELEEIDLNRQREQEELARLEEARKANREKIESYDSRLATIKDELTAIETREGALLEEKGSLLSKKKELVEERDRKQALLDEQKAIEEQKTLAEQRVSGLDAETASHLGFMTTLDTRAASVQTNIAALEEELASLERQRVEAAEKAAEVAEQHEKMQEEIRLAAETSLEADKAALEAKSDALYDHVNDRQVYVDEESGKLYWKDEKGARQDYDDGTLTGALMEKSLKAALSVKSFMGNDKTGADVEKAQEAARTAEENRVSVAQKTVTAVTEMQEATQKVAEIEQKIAETKQQIAAGNAQTAENDPSWNTSRSGISASGSGIQTDSPLNSSFMMAAKGVAPAPASPGPTVENEIARMQNNQAGNQNRFAMGGM